jgi:DNA invertase Pin-like site-specific DNA recombinase
MKDKGEERESFTRQKTTCEMYAKRNGISVLNTFYDAGVSGKVHTFDREEFKRMIVWCKENDVSTILIEKGDRFARDVVGQEVSYKSLTDMGFEILSASGDVKFDDDIHASLLRQIMGAYSEYDRKNISMRLIVARKRKEKENKEKGYLTRMGNGKCSGRKSYYETNEDLVRETKRLARRNPLTKKKRSLRSISSILFDLGYTTANNTPFSATQIKRLVA